MSVDVYVCCTHVCVCPYVRERDTGRERGRGNLRVLDMDGGEYGPLSSVLLPWVQQGSYRQSPR